MFAEISIIRGDELRSVIVMETKSILQRGVYLRDEIISLHDDFGWCQIRDMNFESYTYKALTLEIRKIIDSREKECITVRVSRRPHSHS